MLRYLYTLSDLISLACALVSPVVIFHWLFKISDAAPMRGVVQMLDPLFMPLVAVMELVVKTPPLQYGGHTYPTTQAAFACVLTCLFFVFNFIAESLKVSEQQLSVQTDALMQRRRLQKIQDEKKKKDRVLPQNFRVFVFIDFDVLSAPGISGVMDKLSTKEGGQIHSRVANEMGMEFPTSANAVGFALGLSQAILSHFAKERAFKQPPFKISVHSMDKNYEIRTAIAETHRLIGFAANNQTIVSQSTKSLLEAGEVSIAYHLQSLGIYSMEDGSQQELFKLFAGKQSNSF